jgi:four helix bundle protein
MGEGVKRSMRAGERGSGGEKELEAVLTKIGSPVRSHEDLEVYQMSFDAAMRIFEISKKFPTEEKYSLTDQIRRSSRSVCSNIAESWRKRRYKAAFISKLNDAESEAAETQTWLKFAVQCNYLSSDTGNEMYKIYDFIIGKLVSMIIKPTPWLMPLNLRNE